MAWIHDCELSPKEIRVTRGYVNLSFTLSPVGVCESSYPRNRFGLGDLETAGRRGDYSISIRFSERPFAVLAADTPAPTRKTFHPAFPDHCKSLQCCKARHNALAITSTVSRARSAPLLACPPSQERSRAAM